MSAGFLGVLAFLAPLLILQMILLLVPRDAQRATSKQTELKSLKEKREEDK
jgi:hypothetical protein